MNDSDQKKRPDPHKERLNQRLKAALRENLRRRKAQERGREAATAPLPPSDEDSKKSR